MAVEVMGDNTINEERLNIVKKITLLNVYMWVREEKTVGKERMDMW